MIRVMIVDDEPLARAELKRLIALDKDFEITGEAQNGEEAVSKLSKQPADVVFLDIEMPGMTGLEVAGRLAEWENPPLVVFATAYHQYAVEAFEANAMDYVLKPFEANRLQKTLQRVKAAGGPKESRQHLVSLQDHLIQKGILKKFTGYQRNRKDRIVIDPSDVAFFSAEAEEVVAHLEGQDLIIKATLKEVLEQLDPAKFTQTHKGFIINLDKIQKVCPMFSGNFEITLKLPGDIKVPLSRRFAPGVKKLLGSW